MDGYDYHRLKAQAAVLKDVLEDYPTSTVANALSQIESRIKQYDKNETRD